jgi:hypothetical protein
METGFQVPTEVARTDWIEIDLFRANYFFLQLNVRIQFRIYETIKNLQQLHKRSFRKKQFLDALDLGV